MFILIHTQQNCGNLKSWRRDEMKGKKSEKELVWACENGLTFRGRQNIRLKVEWHFGWVFIQFVSAFPEYPKRLSSFCLPSPSQFASSSFVSFEFNACTFHKVEWFRLSLLHFEFYWFIQVGHEFEVLLPPSMLWVSLLSIQFWT